MRNGCRVIHGGSAEATQNIDAAREGGQELEVLAVIGAAARTEVEAATQQFGGRRNQRRMSRRRRLEEDGSEVDVAVAQWATRAACAGAAQRLGDRRFDIAATP